MHWTDGEPSVEILARITDAFWRDGYRQAQPNKLSFRDGQIYDACGDPVGVYYGSEERPHVLLWPDE